MVLCKVQSEMALSIIIHSFQHLQCDRFHWLGSKPCIVILYTVILLFCCDSNYCSIFVIVYQARLDLYKTEKAKLNEDQKVCCIVGAVVIGLVNCRSLIRLVAQSQFSCVCSMLNPIVWIDW
jgi:hypothetical protein